MLGWTVADIPLLLALPVLLIGSGFFSGSETAIFGLRPHHLTTLREMKTRPARAALTLLQQPRMLLITLLLGNMLVNVLYFVISSVLLLHIDLEIAGPFWPVALGIGSLTAIILAAEVIPKLVATQHTVRWLLIAGVPLLILHEILLPLRLFIATIIIEPMLRLLGTTRTTNKIDFRALADFLQLAEDAGTISTDEERFLRAVVELSRLKVRDAMTPRVRITALAQNKANIERIIQTARKQTTRFLPLYEESLDHLTGIVDLQALLRRTPHSLEHATLAPTYIPELATLDHLLEHFRNTHTKCVVAVDEFGQTAGLITLDDVIEEIIGSDLHRKNHQHPAIILRALGRWRVAPDLNVYEFAEAFNLEIGNPPVATIGGLIVETLERIAEPGDGITLGKWKLTVAEVDGPRITAIEITEAETTC